MDVLTVNFQDKTTPLFEQLYRMIKREIEQEQLVANEKLPSKRRLSEYLHISQNTVQAAYQQLLDEGYIYSKERHGYYVAKLDSVYQITGPVEPMTAENSEEIKSILYDFAYQGVDANSFPYKIWSKLSKEIIHEYDQELHQLGHPKGYYPLRQSISSYLLHARGVHARPEQILVSAGTEFLLELLFHIIDDNSIYGIEDPGYGRLKLLFEQNKITYQPVGLDDNGISLTDMKRKNVDLISITPSHQFPTGIIYPVSKRQELLKWAYEKSNRYIIEDDYDSEFKYAGKPILALKAMDQMDKVIYIGSFSKSISPSIRISYMVLPENLLLEYQRKIPYLLCPVPTTTQKVMHRFIQDGHFVRHLNRMRTHYKKKRELLVHQLKTISRHLEILGADAGLHLVLQLHRHPMSERELVEAARKQGVQVYGISEYAIDIKKIRHNNSLLLGYGSLPESAIKPAVALLKNAWY